MLSQQPQQTTQSTEGPVIEEPKGPREGKTPRSGAKHRTRFVAKNVSADDLAEMEDDEEE